LRFSPNGGIEGGKAAALFESVSHAAGLTLATAEPMFELDRLLICDVEFILLPVDAQFKLQMSSGITTKRKIFLL